MMDKLQSEQRERELMSTLEAAREGNAKKSATQQEIDLEGSEEATCPYCGEPVAPYELDEAFFPAENEDRASFECSGCGRLFNAVALTHITYLTEKVNLVKCSRCGAEQIAEYHFIKPPNKPLTDYLVCRACEQPTPRSDYEGKEISQEKEAQDG